MNTDINALIIFCEGPHDSAYVRMVLKKLMGFAIIKLKFSEMPSPFDKLFKTSVSAHAAQDMSLDMAHKFFLPDTVLRNGNNIVFLFNCGGKTQYGKVAELLSTYLPLFDLAETFAEGASEVVKSVQYLFLYDADAEGLNAIVNNLSSEFGTIDGDIFIDGNWQNSKSDFGRTSNDKAVFVWGGNPNQGTLEDIIYPLFEFTDGSKGVVSKASESINEWFTWEVGHSEIEKSVPETERFKKAVLTTVGQRKKPGSSLNVILEQSGLISEDALNSCEITTGFVEFMNDFLEIEI